MAPSKNVSKKSAPNKKTELPKKPAPAVHSFQGIIFDIDNVLIDTRLSYLDTIRWTIEIFLSSGKLPLYQAAARETQPFLLSHEDVHRFKLLGGFNDDWDCCYGLLIYLLSLEAAPRTMEALKKKADFTGLLKKIKDRPLRVDGVVKLMGRPSYVTIEKIGRIFQEVYLGKELFQRIEGRKPFYWKKRGLIHKEKPVFRAPFLRKLKEAGLRLGIATGRPHFEAAYSLKELGILEFFDCMTTMDDVRRQERESRTSLRKPHPYSILETAKKLGLKEGLMYIGDLPDDVLAANRAKESVGIASVAFIGLDSDPKSSRAEMEKQKPDFVLQKPADLAKIVL